VRAGVEAALKKLPKVQGGSGQVYLAQDTARLLDNAEATAKRPATASSPPSICCWRWCWPAAPRPRKSSKDAGVTAQSLNAAIADLRKAAPPTAPRRKTPMTP